MSEQSKMVFLLEADNTAGAHTETLWVTPREDGLFTVDNIPLLVRHLSLGDTVRGQVHDGQLHFLQVAEHAGHSTYHATWRREASEEIDELLRALLSACCSYERSNTGFLAVDVPPNADVSVAYRVLERAEDAGLLAFEEGHYGHPPQ